MSTLTHTTLKMNALKPLQYVRFTGKKILNPNV